MAQDFHIDRAWQGFLESKGVRTVDLLRRADLPEDLFSRQRPSLPPEAFFRLWDETAKLTGDEAPPVALGQALATKVFNPPIFAAFCSPDLLVALNRLSFYKPMVCPMKLDVHETLGGVEASFGSDQFETPSDFVATELVFLVQLARLATQTNVVPVAVEMVSPPTDPQVRDFFGRKPLKGPFNRVVFSREDARLPFVPVDVDFFTGFDPDLQPRLHELKASATASERVLAVLMEALPSGRADTLQVASRLGTSTRSLQRRLASEGTSFNEVLKTLRKRLAELYLKKPEYSISEIAFLLGYADPNSFFRAFNAWTGTTPETMRADLLKAG